MIREYLKRSRWFQILFAVPLVFRRKTLAYFRNNTGNYYKQTVIGGQLVLQPRNISGQFRIDARSDLVARVISTGEFEPKITEVLERLTSLSGDIINIGANVGFYSIFFGLRFPNIRRIYAIEPNPEAYANLQWNVLENHCDDRVETIPMCVGNVAGQATLSVVDGMPEYSSIDEIVHPAVNHFTQHEVVVDIAPLDKVISDLDINPTLVFVDVEGAELLVFFGAEKLLRDKFPLLIFECEDQLLRKFGHSSADLEKFLRALGYTVRNFLAPGLSLVHPFAGEAVAFRSENTDWVAVLRGKGEIEK